MRRVATLGISSGKRGKLLNTKRGEKKWCLV